MQFFMSGEQGESNSMERQFRYNISELILTFVYYTGESSPIPEGQHLNLAQDKTPAERYAAHGEKL